MSVLATSIIFPVVGTSIIILAASIIYFCLCYLRPASFHCASTFATTGAPSESCITTHFNAVQPGSSFRERRTLSPLLEVDESEEEGECRFHPVEVAENVSDNETPVTPQQVNLRVYIPPDKLVNIACT